jgi:hypothetical protein
MINSKERFLYASGFTSGRTKGKKIGTLYAYLNSGEGDVTIKTYFDDLDPLLRLDVMKDILWMIESEIEELEEEFLETIRNKRKKESRNVLSKICK